MNRSSQVHFLRHLILQSTVLYHDTSIVKRSRLLAGTGFFFNTHIGISRWLFASPHGHKIKLQNLVTIRTLFFY